MQMDGFLLIDKAKDITSTQEGSKIKRLFHTKRVGHVGTLDPFATGLLILGVNKATKAIAFFDDFKKEYVATIKLGIATDSLDLTGNVVEQKEAPNLTVDKINSALSSFLGKSKQLPPMTSAIHVNGVKLYKLAHQGKEVDRPLRDIEVFEIELLSYKDDEITFRALVSKGTYIRVLGSDIANKLGTVGHLSALRRTKVGPFRVENAIKSDDVSELSLKSTYEVLKQFSEVISYDEKTINSIKNGMMKTLSHNSDYDKLLVVDSNNNAIAMYLRKDNNTYEFARGLF